MLYQRTHYLGEVLPAIDITTVPISLKFYAVVIDTRHPEQIITESRYDRLIDAQTDIEKLVNALAEAETKRHSDLVH